MNFPEEIEILTYRGGLVDTNAYALLKPAAKSDAMGKRECILVDAPQDCAEWLKDNGLHLATLLLTHGHFDHVHDVMKIVREHGASVYYHPDTRPFMLDAGAYRRFGLDIELEPVTVGSPLAETRDAQFGDWHFQVLSVPGHCPGSVCFFHAPSKNVFVGDTLMAGGMGRCDLPGGDGSALLKNIREKLYTLGDDVKIYSGHGETSTIGVERRTNPFVRG